MAQLAPNPKFRAVDAAGAPLVGGKLFTYTEGTSTPKATYTDSSLGSANTNPVILDARGEADIWLNGAYKFVLKTADDVTIWTVDGVRDTTVSPTLTSPTLSGTLTISSTTVNWTGDPTHTGDHTFQGDVVFSAAPTFNAASAAWPGNPTHSGNHTFSGSATFNGAVAFASTVALSNGALVSGTWTCTPTGVTNVDDVSVSGTPYYVRVGNVVFGFVVLAIMATSNTTTTDVRISLPVASNFTTSTECIGGGCLNNGTTPACVFADAANDAAVVRYVSSGTTFLSHSIWFAYRVL